MKFYNIDKLFIGSVGHAHKVKEGIEFINESIVITIQKNLSLDYHYYDVISDREYKDFYNFFCKSGDSAILTPKSFSLYIDECIKNAEIYNIDKDNPFLKILKKAKKTNRISNKDIKCLIFELNNKENNNKVDCGTEYHEENNFNNNDNSNNQGIDFSYTSILTDKKFKGEPGIGRDNEINELIIALAQDKKNPILVGMSGTGKTTIVDEFAYKIQKNDIPNFLKNKKIIELDMTSLVAGTKYVGTLEEKVKKIVDYAIKNDAIVFIDEIHTVYGAGTSEKSDNNVAGMIKQAIDRQGLRVIGTTTTEEYDKFFSNDALKRRFEKVLVSEPTNEILYQIINKIFNDYSKNNNIKLLKNMDSIINILINLTSEKHRTWDDKVCNPDLVIGIIDRMFADAKVNNQNKLTINNIIYGIKSCNRVYDSIKEDAISNLDIVETTENPKQKIIQFKKKN